MSKTKKVRKVKDRALELTVIKAAENIVPLPRQDEDPKGTSKLTETEQGFLRLYDNAGNIWEAFPECWNGLEGYQRPATLSSET